MSIEIINKSINYFSKISSVDTKNKESLAEYVKRIRKDKRFSTIDVENNSRKGGLKGISNGYVSQIENSYIQNVSPDKLKALAKGLGVTEEEIFAIARGSLPIAAKIIHERFAQIAEFYADLPEQDRNNIEPLITALELTVLATRSGMSHELTVRKGKETMHRMQFSIGSIPKDKKLASKNNNSDSEESNDLQDIDGKELAPSSKRKILLDEGIKSTKRKTG